MLLPGERAVLRLRPNLAADPATHLGALALALWSLVLWLLFRSAGFNQPVVWWQPWTWFIGNDLAAYLWMAVGPLGVGAACLTLLRRKGAFYACVAVTAGAALFALVLGRPAAQGLPLGTALAALLLAAFAEARRRSSSLTLTNLRIVAARRFPRRREAAVRHADLVELELRQGPLQRLTGSGELVALESDGARTLFTGLARAALVRDAAQALVRQATATPYLREAQGLDREVAEALAALQRR